MKWPITMPCVTFSLNNHNHEPLITSEEATIGLSKYELRFIRCSEPLKKVARQFMIIRVYFTIDTAAYLYCEII